MKTIVLKYDAGRRVWQHHASGFSVCHWLDDQGKESDAMRERITGDGEHGAAAQYRKAHGEDVEVVFDETTFTSALPHAAAIVPITRFAPPTGAPN
jgi:hypothetical protein